MLNTGIPPRVLVFSQRNIFGKTLFRCPHFEFEDIIARIDSAELLAPVAHPFNLRHKLAKQFAYHTPVVLNPGVERIKLKQDYDLFFTICGDPTDLLMVNSACDWRSHCKTAICLIDELWETEMQNYHRYLQMLERFDVVMLYYNQSVGPLSNIIGSRCVFLPPGVDSILFCPYPNPPQRVVDVYSIGRRSAKTHASLLQMSEDAGCFYLHDSIAGSHAIHAAEHRNLYANIVKRSRYFIVNPGLIDRPDIRGKQIEIGNRYFEGAAAGAVLVGERPNNREFESLFDWPDAVLHVPYDSTDIREVICNLDRDQERQDMIRRSNVVGALARHDWMYRWEEILKAAELQRMPGAEQRKERLDQLAETVRQSRIGVDSIRGKNGPVQWV